jgi:hypothetical protein
MSVGTMLSLIRRYHGLNPDAAPQLTLPVTLVASGNYHFAGGSYGSVVFPTEPADAQVIASFLGAPLAHTEPGAVDVIDRSGRGLGSQVAAGLSAAGLTVTAVRRQPVQASPSETVVRYRPGELAAAASVRSALAGAVMLHPDAQVPTGTTVVEVGSVVRVAPSVVTGPTPSTVVPARPTTSTTAVPTPGGEPVTPSVTPLQVFDPRGC